VSLPATPFLSEDYNVRNPQKLRKNAVGNGDGTVGKTGKSNALSIFLRLLF